MFEGKDAQVVGGYPLGDDVATFRENRGSELLKRPISSFHFLKTTSELYSDTREWGALICFLLFCIIRGLLKAHPEERIALCCRGQQFCGERS
jgi:hypothetical protein